MKTTTIIEAAIQLQDHGINEDTAFNMARTAFRTGRHGVAICTHTPDKQLVSVLWERGWWKTLGHWEIG